MPSGRHELVRWVVAALKIQVTVGGDAWRVNVRTKIDGFRQADWRTPAIPGTIHAPQVATTQRLVARSDRAVGSKNQIGPVRRQRGIMVVPASRERRNPRRGPMSIHLVGHHDHSARPWFLMEEHRPAVRHESGAIDPDSRGNRAGRKHLGLRQRRAIRTRPQGEGHDQNAASKQRERFTPHHVSCGHTSE